VRIDVVLGHRKGLSRLRAIKDKLILQIEQAVDDFPDLHELIDSLRKAGEEADDRFVETMRRAMSRPQLIEDLKKLSEIDERTRKGEREAFALDDDADKNQTAVDDLLRKINLVG
jgi:DNA-binding ferritin-like protein